MTSRIFGSMNFAPMNERQFRRWESRRRGGPFFYALFWGVCVSGFIGFCVVAASMCLIWRMKLDGAVLAAGSFAFVVGLISGWYEWHSQENRFRITSIMNQEKAKTASPEPNGLAL